MLRKDRLEKVLQNLSARGLSQMIVSDPASIFYLTGRWIHPGERLLALYINTDSSKNHIFINELFTVPEDLGVPKVWFSDTDDYVGILAKYLDHTSPCGVEKTFTANFLLRLMELGAATAFINTSFDLDIVRACKDEEEREMMRQASRYNDMGMQKFIESLRGGISEIEVAEMANDIYNSVGADGLSFHPIVEFGPNCAIGHHNPGKDTLKPGDCVILDIGCKCGDYCADMTRTVYYKSISDKNREIYNITREANEAAEAIVAPGVPFCEIDKTARDIITKAGYGPEFTHRLGHSIGTEVHEFGDVSSSNTDPVRPGMVFSCEPGIYIVGECGVRIEDLVLVTETGHEILNGFTKDFIIVD